VRVAAPAERLVAGSEHCVVMRRLPEGRDALSGLAAGWLDGERLDAVARVIAAFHAAHGLGAPAPFTPDAWRERILAPVRECFRVIETAELGAGPAELGRASEARAHEFLGEHWRWFEARLARGRIVDGHGDLHLQHVWFETPASEPIAIDCLEFRDDYRQIDRASEVAFLAMDLAHRGRADLAEHFLASYAAHTDDFDLYRVVDWFLGYRAAVRAKVAALAARDAAIPAAQRERARESALAHLDLTARALERRPRGPLVALCGVIGTGKSSVAARLAQRLRGVAISSDRVRKQLAGLSPTDRSGARPGAGLYAPERTQQVYAALCEGALAIVESGRAALLDATHARAELRAALRRFAEREQLRVFLVETSAGADTVLERLRRRSAEGRDPSDAGPELYAESVARYEPPDEWPAAERARVETDRGDLEAQLDAVAARVLRAPRGAQ
jgi:aminoglycoside phosphotransferase family enzyme/predicted kinase